MWRCQNAPLFPGMPGVPQGHAVRYAAATLFEMGALPLLLKAAAVAVPGGLTAPELEGSCPEEVLRVLLLRGRGPDISGGGGGSSVLGSSCLNCFSFRW